MKLLITSHVGGLVGQTRFKVSFVHSITDLAMKENLTATCWKFDPHDEDKRTTNDSLNLPLMAHSVENIMCAQLDDSFPS